MEKNRNSGTNTGELEKMVSHIIVEIIEYVPNAVLSRTIIKRSTGNITAMSFAKGEELGDKTIPFDTFVQVIDGEAHIIVNGTDHLLPLGTGIIIPAHSTHRFTAAEKFKLLCTVIKSGYEDDGLFS